MPAILKPEDYDRWLSTEPDPQELLISYPAVDAHVGDLEAGEHAEERR
jgi:putative SOS response-associated peptidase YedK